MIRSSIIEMKYLIEKFLIKNYGTKFIGQINTAKRTNFCIDPFKFFGRKLQKTGFIKMHIKKYIFFINKKNWEGIYSSLFLTIKNR